GHLERYLIGELLAARTAEVAARIRQLEASITFADGDREHALDEVGRILAREPDSARRSALAEIGSAPRRGRVQRQAVALRLHGADGIRDFHVTGVQTCALPIWPPGALPDRRAPRCQDRRGRRPEPPARGLHHLRRR